MTMTAIHHFEVNGLWVAADALGSHRQVRFRGRACQIFIPGRANDFDLDKYERDQAALGGYVKSTASGLLTKAAVTMVRVEVEMEGNLTAQQAPSGGPIDRVVVNEATRILQESADLARELVAGVLAWMRVNAEQYWLEPVQHLPRVTWLSQLRDEIGERLAVGYNDPLEMFGIDEHQHAITKKELEAGLERAAAAQLPSLPETLLADAYFYAWRAAHPNPRLGLMLAAIACETKIKSFLTEQASEVQQTLVALVLENPRDVSVAAATLFDKGLASIGWPSLRTDNRELFKDVVKLFEDRNKFAHRGGEELDETSVRKDLASARAVFKWLDMAQRRPGA